MRRRVWRARLLAWPADWAAELLADSKRKPLPPPCCQAQPVMVIGNATGTLCVLWFGLSRSYGQAVASRAVGGAFNAIILAEKAIIGGWSACGAVFAVCERNRVQCADCRPMGSGPAAPRADLLRHVSSHHAAAHMRAGEGLPDKDTQAKAFGLMSLVSLDRCAIVA